MDIKFVKRESIVNRLLEQLNTGENDDDIKMLIKDLTKNGYKEHTKKS